MIPTSRLVLVACIPLVLGFAVLVDPWFAVPMAALDVVIVLVAVADALLTRGRPTVERELAPVQAVGKDFPVTLHVRAGRIRALRITDDAPGQAHGLPARALVSSTGALELTYRTTIPERGVHTFGPVTLRWSSPLGLFERQRRIQVDDRVRVYPVFGQLRSWGLLARQAEARVPVRVRRRPGGENEFERLRPYVRGDAYRHVDWRATARRAQLITRDYGQESNQNVIFLLDAGRMMSGRSEGLSAFDHALDAAVMMGQVALRHGDRVGMLIYDDAIRAWLPPKGGARTGSRLIRGTYDVFPSLREPDHVLALRWLAQHVRRRSLVVMMTSVVDDVNADAGHAIVKAMVGKHLPLVVWLRDRGLEALLQGGEARDPYDAGAAAELLVRREEHLRAMRRRGALVIDADPEAVTPQLLGRYLEIKARRLL